MRRFVCFVLATLLPTVASDGPVHSGPNAEKPATTPAAVAVKGMVEKSPLSKADVEAEKQKQEALQNQLDMARSLRLRREFEVAESQAAELLVEGNPVEIRRLAMIELANIAVDAQQYGKAQQVYSEYLRRFSKDPSLPEICLRQGMLYRQMGAHQQALSKFYQVMNYSLNLKLDQLEYYQNLVLKAQIEIAETHFAQGKFLEASDFYTRLLKSETKALDRAACQFKLIRALSAQELHEQAIAQALSFMQLYPDASDVAEARFMVADALKKLGRNRESMAQVLQLLQGQQKQAQKHPELWAYWQQRTGNEIANQLYKEGDYLSALEIYLGLAKISTAPAWQLPVWYQIGLVYEHLRQPRKAGEMYDQIARREAEVRTGSPTTGLLTVLEMAQWRLSYLKWGEKTDTALAKLRLPAPTMAN